VVCVVIIMAISYEEMVLESNAVPLVFNIAAATCAWLLLSGFSIFPATFTALHQTIVYSQYHVLLSHSILPFVALCTTTGVIGLLWLWYKWKHNYIWLLSHVFMYE
jgi:hypothetical protein